MSHWITMVTNQGPMNGWLADPDDRPVGGIVLVHDLYGVNADMRKNADRYAAEGYLSVVPALFDKLQRDVELDYTPANFQKGHALASQIGYSTAIELVTTAADAICHAGKIAIIGYGWGGLIALRAAQALRAPGISYYGAYGSPAVLADKEIPTLIHYGRLDNHYSLADWTTEKSTPPGHVEVFSYETGYAFDREEDPLHSNAQSANEAFERDQKFLFEHIRSASDDRFAFA